MVDVIVGIAAGLAFFFCAALATKRPRHESDSWLALWFASWAVFCSSFIFGRLGPDGAAVPVLLAGQAALIATGPTQLLYVTSALEGRPRYRLHLIAPLAAVLAVVAALIRAPLQSSDGALIVVSPSLMTSVTALVLPAALSVYPVLVLLKVWTRRRVLKDKVSNLTGVDPGWMRLWAMSSIFVSISVASLAVADRLLAWPTSLYVSAIMAVIAAHLAYVAYCGLIRRSFFFAVEAERPNIAPAGAVAPTRGECRADYARVRELFETKRPQSDPNLTAGLLADLLGWSSERLTQALRHGGGLSFFDAVNAARVRDFQAFVDDSANANVSLMGLAYDAGFGSKSALYDAFRRHVGMSPASWRRQRGL